MNTDKNNNGPLFGNTAFKWRRTISGNLITSIVIIVAITSVLITSFNFWKRSQKAKGIFESKANEYMHYLQDSLEVPIWTFDENTVGKICNSFFENEMIARLRVKNYLGETLFDNYKDDDSELVEKLGEIIHDGNDIGSIAIALTLQPYKENNIQLLKSSMINMLVTIFMIIGATTILMKLFLRNPLDYLYDRIDRIAEGDYEYKTRRYNQMEIEKIISKFNDMAGRVQNREKSLSEINVQLKEEIEERKATEEALLESEDRYRTLTNNLNVGVYRNTTGPKGKFIEANPAIIKMFGYANREEFLSIKVSDLYQNPDDRIKFNAKMLQKGAVMNEEEQLRKKDGTPFIASISAVAVKNEKGEIKYYDGIVDDITERKNMIEALRESEEKYRTVLEASLDPIVVYDMEGKVTYFNPSFTRVFGWSLEERLVKKMDIFVPEDAWPETNKMIEKVLSGESFSGFETRRYTKDGNIIHVNMSAAIHKDRDGNPLGSVINLRDISEQKQLQVQLQRAQKMEAIGTLAGGVAHDLNNILSGLISYPELLLLDIPEDSPLRQPILRIKESGQKAAAIVQDLLTLARRGVAVTEVVNLNDIITDFLDTPEYDILKSLHPNAEFKVNIAPDLLNILGSPVHLSKTIMNLVSNAAESMPDSGKIVISTENIYIDRPIRGYEDVQEGDYSLLSVVDSGIGISPDDLLRIFEPFYTKKEMGLSGTGLGMAVVWGTVKDHNGYIDVQSTVGKGTRCDLYFPVTRREPTEKRTAVLIDEYKGNEKILVVDDIEEQREIAHQILSRLGYSVSTVSGGEEAVDYMKENSADLLILDMIMDPGIDGLETYKRILEFHPGQKAIIASGFSETARVKEAQKLGAGAYIKKPYVLEKMGIAVRAELDKLP